MLVNLMWPSSLGHNIWVTHGHPKGRGPDLVIRQHNSILSAVTTRAIVTLKSPGTRLLEACPLQQTYGVKTGYDQAGIVALISYGSNQMQYKTSLDPVKKAGGGGC